MRDIGNQFTAGLEERGYPIALPLQVAHGSFKVYRHRIKVHLELSDLIFAHYWNAHGIIATAQDAGCYRKLFHTARGAANNQVGKECERGNHSC